MSYQQLLMGFPDGSVGKESACNAADSEDAAWIPWLVRSPGGGHGNPFQYSCLENPVDREGWRATVHRVTKSQTQLSMHPITSYIPSSLHPSSPCNLSFDFMEKFFVPTDLPCPCSLLFLSVLNAQSSGFLSHPHPQLLHCLILLLYPFCKILTLNLFHNPLLDPMSRVLTHQESHTAT